MQLRGANVLITGASRGIGRELALAFASAGATPVLVGRDEAALARVASETAGVALPADLADPAQVAELWGRAEQANGPLGVLVNNAGVASAETFTAGDWLHVEQTVQVNLLAPMRLCRDAVNAMRAAGGGHLVNISSLAGVAATPGLTAYSASKAGLSHFTGVLRTELSGLPIGTTLVELGPVSTDMLSDVKQHPPTERAFRRMGKLRLLVDLSPADVAATVVDAVRTGRRHVRMPRRAAGLAWLVEVPRAASRLALCPRA